MNQDLRLNAEWLTLNAVRGLTKLAAKGDMSKATYDNALELGGELYPELLGPNASLLRRERESDTVKEYRQLARLWSLQQAKRVEALELVQAEITDRRELLRIAKINKDRAKVDQIKRRLALLVDAEKTLNPIAHTENQLIFRDALAVQRIVPPFRSGKAHRDFELPDSNVLRIRVLHPEVPEHMTGADIIYERHSPSEEEASIVVIQYKIWEKKSLYLNEPRMQGQIQRLKDFTCGRAVCKRPEGVEDYRFPYCAGFLRPTDKLQRADQAFISSGEHLPICRLTECSSKTAQGADVLTYDKMRRTSLSAEMFEELFTSRRIGSRMLPYGELEKLYEEHAIESELDTVVIYAQEFASAHETEA
jgi:hypothetical protein